MSAFLSEYFPVFQPSQVKSGGKNTKEYYEQFGWLDFLIEIAKTKAFDIPLSGLNSIDCAEQAPAYDVLVWAGIEKLRAEAQALDAEIEYEKQKNSR